MRSRLLPLVLASALTLTPSRARADGVDSLVAAIVTVVVVGAAVVATTEVLTGVATYKNYRSWKDEREASGGWVGVGGVGGLLNVGIGAYLIVDGLPGSAVAPCPRRETGPSAFDLHTRPPAQEPVPLCPYTTRASAKQLIFGTLMTGFGAFSLAMAIQAARTEPSPAPGSTQAGSVSMGIMLPPLRF